MFEFLTNRVCSLLAQADQATEAVEPAFYQTGWFGFLLLIAAVALGWILANTISGSLRLSEYSGRFAVVFIAIFVAILMVVAKWPPEFGVDLRGGINMVGSLNLDAFNDEEDPNAVAPQAKDIIPALVQRVNPAGTKEIMIRALGTDKIEVTIPSVNLQEADEIWNRLVDAGKLEFRIVADVKYHQPQIDLARKMAEAGSRDRYVYDTNSSGDREIVAVWTSLAREVDAGQTGDDYVAPIKFLPSLGHLVRDKSTGRIIETSEIRASFTSNDPDQFGADFANWCKERNIRTPQILVVQPDESSNVEGKHLANVRAGTDERGRACVNFNTSDEGSSRLGLLTKMNEPDASGNQRLLGIVLDDQLHSAPGIEEAIYRQGRITGSFTQAEVDDLVIKLRSGKLDVALNKAPISKDFINSTLGEELKERGIWAIGASLVLVLVFMLFYYRFAGLVATIALLLNLLLILALVMAINQPLTLTGLAGLVLTVGMSVDANVLVFERIREELDRGAALRMAIRNGFDKATTTIVDANVTTLITALVLYVIGTEQIKGFSVTLILGILMSMFTAIYVSRLIFDVFERKRWLTKLNMTRILHNNRWNFLNKVRFTGVVSVLLIVVGIGGMFLLGPKILSHDLRGGSTVRMVFNSAQDIEAIREELRSQNIEVNGEKIEFTVSGFGTQGDSDDSMKDRVFKVDSNLPAWEGQPDVERFEQLDELLARIFAGRLQLYHADVAGGSSASQAKPTDDGQPPADTKKNWHEMESGSKSAKSLNCQFDVAGSGSAEGTEADGKNDQGQSDTTQDGEASAAESQPSGGDFDSGTSQTPLEVNYVDVIREISVDPPVSGRTLRALIVDASAELDLQLEEDQVQVISPDTLPDESDLSTMSKTWSVKMNVTQEADADRILTAWKETFNQRPYFPTASKVGGQIARNTQFQALAAIIASLMGLSLMFGFDSKTLHLDWRRLWR